MREGQFVSAARRETLAAVFWPERVASPARFVALAVVGTLALAVSAKIQVPFYPVPMTMQTLVILILGAAFGAPLAGATVALYLIEGLIGLPVFAGASAGLVYVGGPTGGYLIGFLVAAIIVGLFAERGWDRSPLRLLATMTIGHVIIFAFGFARLAMLIGAEKAWAVGVAHFFAATIVKTLLAVALIAAFWRAAAPRATGPRSKPRP
jgi:biotin transport system substrate-specific component